MQLQYTGKYMDLTKRRTPNAFFKLRFNYCPVM